MTLANRGVTTHVMLLDHAQDKWFLANDDKVCVVQVWNIIISIISQNIIALILQDE